MDNRTKLLFLHGALGTQMQFDGIKSKLSNEFQIYDLNFDGHGKNVSDNDFSIQLFAKNVQDYILSNNLEGINIFGYSMGGYVALTLALKNPSLVGKIITLGTKFDWNPQTAEREVKMLNPELVEEKVPNFAEKLRNDHHPSDWKKVMRKTADMMLGMGNGLKMNSADLNQIKNQVTIGLGSFDNMVTREESEFATRALPNAKLVILESIPHPIEKGDSSVLANFITDSLSA